jgi:hypothetical protein
MEASLPTTLATLSVLKGMRSSSQLAGEKILVGTALWALDASCYLSRREQGSDCKWSANSLSLAMCWSEVKMGRNLRQPAHQPPAQTPCFLFRLHAQRNCIPALCTSVESSWSRSPSVQDAVLY